MLTVAIDSSQAICALALGEDGQVLAESHFYHKMDLLRRMLPGIEQMLADAGRSPHDLDGVIVSLGPGSFTGLRIGITIAKSLAYVLSKPIVGVGTLDAIAHGVVPCGTDLVCPMIHSRADEVYWSLFDSSGARLTDYGISTIDEVIDTLLDSQNKQTSVEGSRTVFFCGTGAERHKNTIESRLGRMAVIGEEWTGFARGSALLEIGNERISAGDVDDAFTLVPMYVRKPTPVVRLEAGRSQ